MTLTTVSTTVLYCDVNKIRNVEVSIRVLVS